MSNVTFENKNPLPVHPGQIIKQEMDARGISQRKMAIEIGRSPSQLNEIITAKRRLTAESALLICKALGIEPEPLLIMQAKYDLEYVQHNKAFHIQLQKVMKIEEEASKS